ncbi:hypothetical protein ENSA5_62690 [Enhygromyxa salina]|uniref:Uncharacterized protein n=1 Tax=Enhygromyxa salina TaxID=215803 RepID=A0A2S9XD90_9BACT|nr:hypothetical protein [Enhygromyxa salina]PRP90651.1 hypothetical protein ENSA5_62690 [Enhygromyxa salina]
MTDPTSTDDLSFHETEGSPELDVSWAGAAIELDEERPSSGLEQDPTQRKWLLVGAGACALLTAAVVVVLTSSSSPSVAADIAPEPEPQPEVTVEPAAQPEVEAPSVDEAVVNPPVQARRGAASERTLAVNSRAAAPPIHSAPPPPKFADRSSPSPSPKAPVQPASKPAASKAAAAPTPTPAPDPASAPSNPLEDLPDVEGWTEMDDDALREQEPAPVAPSVDVVDEPVVEAPADEAPVDEAPVVDELPPAPAA